MTDDFKVIKGNGRLNCHLEVVGETQFQDYKALVVVVVVRYLSEDGLKIQKTR